MSTLYPGLIVTSEIHKLQMPTRKSARDASMARSRCGVVSCTSTITCWTKRPSQVTISSSIGLGTERMMKPMGGSLLFRQRSEAWILHLSIRAGGRTTTGFRSPSCRSRKRAARCLLPQMEMGNRRLLCAGRTLMLRSPRIMSSSCASTTRSSRLLLRSTMRWWMTMMILGMLPFELESYLLLGSPLASRSTCTNGEGAILNESDTKICAAEVMARQLSCFEVPIVRPCCSKTTIQLHLRTLVFLLFVT